MYSLAKAHKALMYSTRYVIVLEGKIELHVTVDEVAPGEPTEEIITVEAGSSVFLPKGTRVKFVWPGPCKYVPWCD